MKKAKFIQTVVLFSSVITSSNSREYGYFSSNIKSIDVCFYIKTGDSRSCETFPNLTAVREFMSTPHIKVEIHDQVLTKLHKYYFARVIYTRELVIRNCGLVEIEPGAFQDSISFLKFDMQNNELEVLRTGVFNYLLITHLNLNRNKISTIEPDALSYLENIEEVSLLNNRISAYDWKWFNKTPLLKSLYFQHNTIKEIPERAFRNLIDRPGDLNIFFSFNEIRFIHPLAFDNMANTTIRKLYLDHNLLETWTGALSMNINELEISFNNIKCLYGGVEKAIKNNSLRSFVGNPYECHCLKEIKTNGDRRGEYSDWFFNEYLKCRDSYKKKTAKRRPEIHQNIQIFSSS